ncbi:MAG: hypothetical protein ACI3T9_04385 [Romboutsia timonensis]
MFDYKKHYVFKKDLFLADREVNGIEDTTVQWITEADGEYVKLINEGVGICGAGYLVHPDWCTEVDPYTI